MIDKTRDRIVLCVNSGSSSRKIAIVRMRPDGETQLATGAAEGIGTANGRAWIRDGDGRRLLDTERNFSSRAAALHELLDEFRRRGLPDPDAAGHRIVHGGPNHLRPEPVTSELTRDLARLIPFAPLHLPDELEAIEATASRFNGLPQVVCFDTAFHSGMPQVARHFALPAELWDEGVRRYGFHGISYEYITQVLGPSAPSRTVIAHLGNGASMAAVRDGRSIDTTMGFTPTGGFMMGTRSGDLDPGILVYLAREKGYDAVQLEQLVNHRSGLLGASGISSDMKILLEASSSNPKAAFAVAAFCYQARKSIGALTATLGGLDLLVFTAGIGERAALVRSEICRGLAYLGIRLDESRNDAHADIISAPESRCAVRVIPTNEDLMIARHTYRVVFASG